MNKFNNMRGKQVYIAHRLDIDKAYDILKWDFNFSGLKDLGFHDTWIKWIGKCIVGPNFYIILYPYLLSFGSI